jgi:hypothetical protein
MSDAKPKTRDEEVCVRPLIEIEDLGRSRFAHVSLKNDVQKNNHSQPNTVSQTRSFNQRTGEPGLRQQTAAKSEWG